MSFPSAVLYGSVKGELVFSECEDAFFLQLAQFMRKRAPIDTEKRCHLLPGEGDRKRSFLLPFRLHGQIGQNTFPQTFL